MCILKSFLSVLATYTNRTQKELRELSGDTVEVPVEWMEILYIEFVGKARSGDIYARNNMVLIEDLKRFKNDNKKLRKMILTQGENLKQYTSTIEKITGINPDPSVDSRAYKIYRTKDKISVLHDPKLVTENIRPTSIVMIGDQIALAQKKKTFELPLDFENKEEIKLRRPKRRINIGNDTQYENRKNVYNKAVPKIIRKKLPENVDKYKKLIDNIKFEPYILQDRKIPEKPVIIKLSEKPLIISEKLSEKQKEKPLIILEKQKEKPLIISEKPLIISEKQKEKHEYKQTMINIPKKLMFNKEFYYTFKGGLDDMDIMLVKLVDDECTANEFLEILFKKHSLHNYSPYTNIIKRIVKDTININSPFYAYNLELNARHVSGKVENSWFIQRFKEWKPDEIKAETLNDFLDQYLNVNRFWSYVPLKYIWKKCMSKIVIRDGENFYIKNGDKAWQDPYLYYTSSILRDKLYDMLTLEFRNIYRMLFNNNNYIANWDKTPWEVLSIIYENIVQLDCSVVWWFQTRNFKTSSLTVPDDVIVHNEYLNVEKRFKIFSTRMANNIPPDEIVDLNYVTLFDTRESEYVKIEHERYEQTWKSLEVFSYNEHESDVKKSYKKISISK
jgi:hypothetical protein